MYNGLLLEDYCYNGLYLVLRILFKTDNTVPKSASEGESERLEGFELTFYSCKCIMDLGERVNKGRPKWPVSLFTRAKLCIAYVK